ncbi:MAG: hypothetical protein WKF83_11055 [Nocardioidaceae bacterium]
MGETDRVYPLDREPAEHGLRDPRAETDVLTRLRLTDAQASVLATAADARLVPEQRLRGADAVELAEQVLPGLRESDQLDVIIDGEQPDFREAAGTPVVSFASVDHGSDPNRRTDWLDLEVVVTVDHRSRRPRRPARGNNPRPGPGDPARRTLDQPRPPRARPARPPRR